MNMSFHGGKDKTPRYQCNRYLCKLVYLLAFPQVQCILIENKTDQFSTWDQLKTVPEVIVKWRFGKDTSWQNVIQHGRNLARV